MPLSNTSNASPDPDLFTDTDYSPDMDTSTPYTPAPSLAPFSFFFGYSESDRIRYTTLRSNAVSRLLGLELTPPELSAQTYYDSVFYAYESYGDLLGTTSGLLLGSALRNRKPGIIPATIARVLRQHNHKGTRIIAISLRLVVFGVLGRLYGLTTARVQALNRIRNEQGKDPRMARLVAAKAKKISAVEKEIRAGGFRSRGRTKGGAVGDVDGQSLGGMEIADQQRRSDEADVDAENRAFPFGRPSEKVAEIEQRTPRNSGDDPFFDSVEHEEVPQQQRGGWKNTHSNTTESTWERLRRGQSPASPPSSTPPPDDGSSQQSPWPQRAPMKGFSSIANNEPKTDSFSFSKTVEERELAKIQAQKEFDESVERERRSGMQGGSGDRYSEDGKGGKGKW